MSDIMFRPPLHALCPPVPRSGPARPPETVAEIQPETVFTWLAAQSFVPAAFENPGESFDIKRIAS
ncbi:protein of unknown function [Acidithiobacillus ferrivorans]|uniref:Uncharacterized protein n=1 Tax=Acidithiobacillus ferrivorans TaxID=160808 RepID=A0ABY1MST0_9PROT|nr:protein of unknown function [Acidithiobacillus ferrivorans]